VSWDATLYGSWNYTHNINRMIRKIDPDWWDSLDGLTAAEGAEYLDRIVLGMAEAPELFRAMNPENGWGDYDGLMRVLGEMRAESHALAGADVRWEVSG